MDDSLNLRIRNLEHVKNECIITNAQIDEVEDELSFAFPSDYRSFILTFGVLFLDGHIIRGIYEEDEQELESFGVSILETKRERKNRQVYRLSGRFHSLGS